MNSQQTVLIVDDIELNIETLLELLGDRYDLLAATDAKDALEIIHEEHIDLILLDIVMPGINGYEMCQMLKKDTKTADIPIIFITSKTDEDSIEYAYDVGGIDYITKPFRAKEVLSRVSTHLALSRQQHDLELIVAKKTKELQDINKELEDTQREMVFIIGVIGEHRSRETANHVMRVAKYSEILAVGYGLDEKRVKLLKEASPMHDIGKVGIADNILNKPGKFTQEEFEQMKQHASLGYEMLKYSHRELLEASAIVAYQHHEKWDGSGYPQGLLGEEIHIYGRITAVADVFDALGSVRVYKEAWSDDKIFEYFKKERGGHFEPKLVDVLFDNLDEILLVRDKFKDLN
jgi:putative two-component system response regulator